MEIIANMHKMPSEGGEKPAKNVQCLVKKKYGKWDIVIPRYEIEDGQEVIFWEYDTKQQAYYEEAELALWIELPTKRTLIFK